MFTSSGREEDVARSYKFGTNTYIQKPVGFEDFTRAISLVEEYWGGLAKLPPARYGLGQASA
jgi:DNA-binding NarL/FixJ family response regulator